MQVLLHKDLFFPLNSTVRELIFEYVFTGAKGHMDPAAFGFAMKPETAPWGSARCSSQLLMLREELGARGSNRAKTAWFVARSLTFLSLLSEEKVYNHILEPGTMRLTVVPKEENNGQHIESNLVDAGNPKICNISSHMSYSTI